MLDHGEGVEALARESDNRGRRGGQPAASDALIAALAAVKDTKQIPCRELHGQRVSATHCPRTFQRRSPFGAIHEQFRPYASKPAPSHSAS